VPHPVRRQRIHAGSANGDPSRLRMPPPRSAMSVGITPTPSATRSRPVNTPSMPATPRPAPASIAIPSVWAWGERTKRRMDPARCVDVLGVAALTGQETNVLAPPDRRPDAVAGHVLEDSRRQIPSMGARRAPGEAPFSIEIFVARRALTRAGGWWRRAATPIE
jgi:hypothetical protein